MMKIFSWIRSKSNGTAEGNNNINNPNPHPKSYHHIMQQQQSCKQEFSDWPNGLLAIGTFGNTKHSDNNATTTSTAAAAQDLEEVDRELRLLLLKEKKDENSNHLSVEQLLDCIHNNDIDLERVRSVVERGKQDVKPDKKKRGIANKSFSFLMKKLLLCGAPPPIIRDPNPLPDSKLDHSTMEKILRAMLHKKIYPQRPATPNIKYLDQRREHDDDDEQGEACTHTSTWDKTDSEYIVLEI